MALRSMAPSAVGVSSISIPRSSVPKSCGPLRTIRSSLAASMSYSRSFHRAPRALAGDTPTLQTRHKHDTRSAIMVSMTPLQEWLKPPKSLLLILFLLTLVSVAALAWAGWKLLEEDRLVQAQQRQEILEQEADRITATVRGSLAESGDRLSASLASPPPAGTPKDGVLLIVRDYSFTAYPSGRLLYYPAPSNDPEAPPQVFAEAESFEFQDGQLTKAAAAYRALADSGKDAAIRAGALLRLARVLRKLGHEEEARAAYMRLAGMGGVRVAGVPADLLARHEFGDPNLKKDLLAGRWRLT